MAISETFLLEQYKLLVDERRSLVNQNYRFFQLTVVGAAALYAWLFSNQASFARLPDGATTAVAAIWFVPALALCLIAVANLATTRRYRRIEEYLFSLERNLNVAGWETWDRAFDASELPNGRTAADWRNKFEGDHKNPSSGGELAGGAGFIILILLSFGISWIGYKVPASTAKNSETTINVTCVTPKSEP